MINAKDAKQKTIINRKCKDLMDKIEQDVEKAIGNGYCCTSINLDSELDKEIIDALCKELIGLGYRVKYVPAKPLDQWTLTSYLRIDWSLKKLENWTEITKGLYRYVIAASACYEIHIKYHAKDTDILTANASLYIVGDWTTAKDNSKFFERKLLLNGPLMACLEKAVENEKELRG